MVTGVEARHRVFGWCGGKLVAQQAHRFRAHQHLTRRASASSRAATCGVTPTRS
jgi:hypothetical protein